MSADRWSVCPRCLRKHKAIVKVGDKALENAYGLIPAEQYRLAHEVQTKLRQQEVSPSMREDWGISLNAEGVFKVSYGALCINCGFKFYFDKKELVAV